MQAGSRTKIYTRGLWCKVEEADADAVERLASEAGIRPSVWVRRAVKRALKGNADTRFLAAEIAGLRGIVLRLALPQGPDAEPDTPEYEAAMQRLVAIGKEVDARRFAIADARLLRGDG